MRSMLFLDEQEEEEQNMLWATYATDDNVYVCGEQ